MNTEPKTPSVLARENERYQVLGKIRLAVECLTADRPLPETSYPPRGESAVRWLKEAIEKLEGREESLSFDELKAATLGVK